jgi:hypothetical protein
MRLAGALFGFLYGAIAGICLPLALLEWVSERVMRESVAWAGLLLAGPFMPAVGVIGAIVGASIGWLVAASPSRIGRHGPRVRAPDPRPTLEQPTAFRPIAAVLAFTAVFSLFHWAVSSTAGLILLVAESSRTDGSFSADLALPLDVLHVVAAAALARYVFYVSRSREHDSPA